MERIVAEIIPAVSVRPEDAWKMPLPRTRIPMKAENQRRFNSKPENCLSFNFIMTHYTNRPIAGQLPYSIYILSYQRVANYPAWNLNHIRLSSEDCKALRTKNMPDSGFGLLARSRPETSAPVLTSGGPAPAADDDCTLLRSWGFDNK